MAPVFYRGSIAISPHRQELTSHGDLTATGMKTKEFAQDVQDAVEQDFTLHYRVTDTENFLNKLLPVQKETLDTILQSVKEEKLYDFQTQRWIGFPEVTRGSKKTQKSHENSMYGPFCAITEAIRGFAEKQRPTDSVMGAMNWVDYHSRSPLSANTQGAQLRPDVLLALQAMAYQTVLKESQGGQEKEAENLEVEAETEAEGEAKERKDEEQAEDLKKGKGKEKDILMQMIWWLQILAAVEMKRTNQNWDDVVKQLFGYMRRILREQLDRRFVFGLTLGGDMMTVWLHDRSGVIGTKSPINIHKDPLKFIQVIASFSLLPPEMLGFDPTIEMLVSRNQAVPSYNPNEEFIRAYQAAPHNRQWVIRMNDGSKYVTVETVSSVRAGFMRGRGSIAWVVVPFDRAKEESKVFVLKQSWRPREVDSEGDLYSKCECEFVGKIELCEEVLISHKKDATDTLIRKGLDDSMGLGKRPRNEDQLQEGEDLAIDPHIHVTCTDAGDIKEVIARESGPPVPRVRTRVILSTYGWLIKYFSTRKELLVVLRDAIRGHKYLYERGVLHRDISPGNILIKWRPGSEADQPSTSGCLIDLDHAKKGKLARDEAMTHVDHKMIDRVQTAIRAVSDIEVDNEVACLSLEFPSINLEDGDPAEVRIRAQTHVVAVIRHASKFRGLPMDQLWIPQHLGWKSVEISYDFKFTERRKGSRTGTPPYTSGEILSGRRYESRHQDNVFHDAVHDLESFFWVLVHICITRQGPGGVRREELEQKNQANAKYNGLRRVVHCFFDSDMGKMAENKAEIFTHPHEFDQYVLDNFHGYFQSLREVVKEWFHLLILAHQFHSFEYYHIHDMVLEILDHALESAPPEDINKVAQEVLDGRKANIKKLLDGNSFGMVQQSPPPHTSPTTQRMGAQPVYRSPPSSPTPAPKKKVQKMGNAKK